MRSMPWPRGPLSSHVPFGWHRLGDIDASNTRKIPTVQADRGVIKTAPKLAVVEALIDRVSHSLRG